MQDRLLKPPPGRLSKADFEILTKVQKNKPKTIIINKFPKKNCKKCYGRGWIGESVDKRKTIVPIIGEKQQPVFVITCSCIGIGMLRVNKKNLEEVFEELKAIKAGIYVEKKELEQIKGKIKEKKDVNI